jgi:hypothetical protein
MIGGVVWATRSEQAERQALAARRGDGTADGPGGEDRGGSPAAA